MRDGWGTGLCRLAVEDEEADADQEEEGELEEDDDAGAEQGEAGLAQVAGGEHALDHELVGAVRGHREEGAAEDAGPEGVALRQVQGEVEHVELAQRRGNGDDVGPVAGGSVTDGPQGDECAGDVEGHLDDVGPDDGGHTAFECVKKREGGDDGDGQGVSGAYRDGDDDGDGEDSNALGGGAGAEEEPSGDLVQDGAEAAVDELVGGEHLAAEVFWKKQEGDDDASEHVAEDDLQEAHVAAEGYAGDGDDGEGAGFG